MADADHQVEGAVVKYLNQSIGKRVRLGIARGTQFGSAHTPSSPVPGTQKNKQPAHVGPAAAQSARRDGRIFILSGRLRFGSHQR
jgi:hypothetical protein